MTNKLFKQRIQEALDKERKVTAYLRQDGVAEGKKAFWLMIDRPYMEGIAIGAITEDEIRPIMEACASYLTAKNDKIKVSEG